MKKSYSAVITFLSSVIVIILSTKCSLTKNIAIWFSYMFSFSSDYEAWLETIINSFLIALVGKCLDKLRNSFCMTIEVNYFDFKGQVLTNIKLKSGLDTSNVMVRTRVKYSEHWKSFLSRIHAYILVYINPKIGKFDLATDFLDGNKLHLEPIKEGIKYHFTEDFYSSKSLTSLDIGLTFNCFMPGEGEIQVKLTCEKKYTSLFLAAICFLRLCNVKSNKLIVISELEK